MALKILLLTCLLFTAPGALLAQEDWLSGPVSGLVFDARSGAIRPIIGVPGASYLGAATASGLEWASISPDGKLALVFARGRLSLWQSSADGFSGGVLLEDAFRPALAAWSEDSSAAAVSWRESNKVQVWQRLGSGPPGVSVFDFSDVGQVSGLAVERSGGVVVAVDASPSGGLYAAQARSRARPRRLLSMERPGAVVLSGGDNLFVADLARGQVVEVRDYRGAAEAKAVADERTGLVEPVALALARNGGRLIVADKARSSLKVYDLGAGTLAASHELSFVPTRLDVLPSGSMFLLNESSANGEALHVFDESREAGVFFVPGAPAQEGR